MCVCVCVHCRSIQGGCVDGSPPAAWGCSPVGVFPGVCLPYRVCTARKPPCVCLRVYRVCVMHGAWLRVRKCTHGALGVCYGLLVRRCVCTLSVRYRARVCAACPTCVDVPWTLAGCTCAVCPRHAVTAPDDGARCQSSLWAWGRRASWGHTGYGVSPLVPSVCCSQCCGCFWGLASPPLPGSTAARVPLC